MVLDLRMVVGGLWYLAPVLLLDMDVLSLTSLAHLSRSSFPPFLYSECPHSYLVGAAAAAVPAHPHTRPMLTATRYAFPYIGLVAPVLCYSGMDGFTIIGNP